MRSIRDSIENSRFEQDKEAFMKHYSHDIETDGMKDHVDEVDNESLGTPLKKKRNLVL
jgi:queuine tRNA-ribosyltransferase subunit QTRTD1